MNCKPDKKIFSAASSLSFAASALLDHEWSFSNNDNFDFSVHFFCEKKINAPMGTEKSVESDKKQKEVNV